MDRQTFTDIGLLIARLAVAIVFVVHGFGDVTQEGGVATNVANYTDVGIPLAALTAPFAAYLQLVGGVLFGLGLFTRIIAVGFAGVMLGAWYFVHNSGAFLVDQNGFEFVFVLAAVSAMFVLVGAGRYSLDHVFGGWWERTRGRPGVAQPHAA